MPWDVAERWNGYIGFLFGFGGLTWALRATILNSFRAHGIGAFSRAAKWHEQAFALWFKTQSIHIVAYEDKTEVPKLMAHASGTILELGPGIGSQIARYDQDKVKHIYGIEPNESFVPDIQLSIKEHGMDGRYTLILCGAEDTDVLAKHGITAGSFDTIVSMQVLCSVPKPDAVMKGLYRLLKPGGKFIFWEHRQSHDQFTSFMQSFLNLHWRYFMGGCNINRNIHHILQQAGEWDNLEELENGGTPCDMLPRIWGELVKKQPDPASNA